MSNFTFSKESGMAGKHSAPMVDISQPGQQVIRDYKNIQYSPRYVQQRANAVLVRAPRLFDYMPGGAYNRKILQSLIETRHRSLTGINLELTPEYYQEIEGGDAKRETLNNVLYSDPAPVFTFPEVKDRAIGRWFENWLLWLGLDPATGYARIASSQSYIDAAKADPSLQVDVPEANSFAMLVYEPNANLDGIVSAVLLEDCKPKSAITNSLQRVQQEALQTPDIEMEFTNIPIRGDEVMRMAKEHLLNIPRAGLNSANAKLHIEGIAGNVLASGSGIGSILDRNATVGS